MAHTIKSIITPTLLRDIQDFWFLNFTAEARIVSGPENVKRWFMGGEALDKACAEKFLPSLEALRKTGVTSGTEILDAIEPSQPCDWMSLLILLDQIPRNCYRGTSSSVVFNEFDPLARQVARAAIARGIPDQDAEIRWQFSYRNWFYMPLMHSEDLTDHEQALEGFKKIVRDVESLTEQQTTEGAYHAKAREVVLGDVEAARKMAKMNLDFEQLHYDIIERFGRYPHRNKALGREATGEETEYLENGGHTFG
ncbi:class I alpha-mannosidase [Pochonia chlamydosporia 170]|uniref:Class I alpha-mannosidase n=1 Tax=Pochonia chlamydosporia 170 TaxID=1380566 RepID=A0A179FXY1_METCM|nr:class I alpha-mannosidase [Pochonia chlamydosporia 170]OAQ69903.1 class I alpha-mannosidase [Pochonia chlamydosporia 170]